MSTRIASLAKNPNSAVSRLSRRMEKRAVAMGPVVESTGLSALAGAIPMALLGALYGRAGGRGQMLHDATVGGIVGAVPGAMFGGLQAYQEQKAREKALRRYMSNGGYGAEFSTPEPK